MRLLRIPSLPMFIQITMVSLPVNSDLKLPEVINDDGQKHETFTIHYASPMKTERVNIACTRK